MVSFSISAAMILMVVKNKNEIFNPRSTFDFYTRLLYFNAHIFSRYYSKRFVFSGASRQLIDIDRRDAPGVKPGTKIKKPKCKWEIKINENYIQSKLILLNTAATVGWKVSDYAAITEYPLGITHGRDCIRVFTRDFIVRIMIVARYKNRLVPPTALLWQCSRTRTRRRVKMHEHSSVVYYFFSFVLPAPKFGQIGLTNNTNLQLISIRVLWHLNAAGQIKSVTTALS